MKKSDIFKIIKKVMERTGLSVYALAKITGINRSTLQKTFEGTRSINIRQFSSVLNAVPLPMQEKAILYKEFVLNTWSRDQFTTNDTVLNIINAITKETEPAADTCAFNYILPETPCHEGVYFGGDAKEALTAITALKVGDAQKSGSVLNIYANLSFRKNVFTKTIKTMVNNFGIKADISILFYFAEADEINPQNNLLTIQNIIPYVLDPDGIYSIHCIYSKFGSAFNYNTPFPYYICFDDALVLLDEEVSKIALIKNREIVDEFIAHHKEQLKAARSLNVITMNYDKCIEFLMNNHFKESPLYSISYEPCLATFVPLDMYDRLIKDSYPQKSEYLRLAGQRLSQINTISKKHTFFNKDSIKAFAETGRIIPLPAPDLIPCTPQERKQVLTNLLNYIKTSGSIFRAFSADNINLSGSYEITNIQSHYDFSVLIYGGADENSVRLINISDPSLSKAFVSFIHDIADTNLVFSQKETVDYIQGIIDKIPDL